MISSYDFGTYSRTLTEGEQEKYKEHIEIIKGPTPWGAQYDMAIRAVNGYPGTRG